MAIKIQCACGKVLSVKDEFAGKRLKCPACRKLLQVPKADVDQPVDEWDLDDSATGDVDDVPAESGKRSGGGKSSPARGSNSRQTSKKSKGKKSKPSNRGWLFALFGGGGLLGIALLAWMLWPAKPGSDVAVAPSQDAAGSVATTGGESASSPSSASVSSGSQPKPGEANPPSPASSTATQLEGDLKFLQGTWQVADMELPPDAPGAAEAVAQMNQVTFTIKDDLLSVATPRGTSFRTIKIDSLQTPKTIDQTSLESGNHTQLGIYSIEGETWRMCSTQGGTTRPLEMKAVDGQGLFTFKRSSAPPAASPASLFDVKTWLAAESKLKAMNVKAYLNQWEKYAGTEALTHCVSLTLPESADGTISPELWEVISSISHVYVATTFSTDATLRQLAQHPGLLGVNMDTRSTVTADGIAALKACPHLQMLVFRVPASPEICEATTQLQHLRGFGIVDSPVSKDMVSSIVRHSQLEQLTLMNTGITDDDAIQIQKLTKLKYLTLRNSQLTDEGLKALASLTQLNGLTIDETKVTDEGLKALTSLTQLKHLSIANTKVTDEGVKTLKSLTGLNFLDLRGTNVTPQGVAELQAALPKCHVTK